MPKPWNLRTAMLAGLIVGLTAAAINWDGRYPAAYSLSKAGGAIIGGVVVAFLVAKLRNRLVFGRPRGH